MKTFIYSLTLVILFFFGCKPKEEEKTKVKKDFGFGIDSLKKLEVDTLNKLAWRTLGQNPDRARNYAKEAVKKAKECGYRKGEGDGVKIVGVSWKRQSEYDSALVCYQKSLAIYKEIGDADGVARVTNNIGTIYDAQGEYEKALGYLIESFKFREEIKDLLGMADLARNIGGVFAKQKSGKEALRWYFQSEKIYKDLLLRKPNDPDILTGLAIIVNAIGMVFDEGKQNFLALEYYHEYKEYAETLHDTSMLVYAFNNMASVYKKEKNLVKVLEYFKKSREFAEKINDKSTIALTKINIARVKLALGEKKEAEKLFLESLKIAEEINDRELVKSNSEELAYLYSDKGDKAWDDLEIGEAAKLRKDAFLFLKRSSDLSDSLLGEESKKNVWELKSAYEKEKKDKEIAILSKEKEIQAEKADKERIRRNFLLLMLGLFIALVLIVFKAFLQKRKDNRIIAEQKQDITDSIIYAKRIQEAILPPLEKVKEVFPESFIFYRPKDIVSGDFYWLYENKESVFMACADCTGHGVPGAFMSMLCVKALNEIAEKTSNPGEILSLLNRKIKETLHQSQSTRDGLDIALLQVTKKEDARILHYAGANRPMFIVRDNHFMEYKATRSAIDGFTPESRVFEMTVREILPGDLIYFSSDGFIDQFGGEKNKRLSRKGFSELLQRISKEPITKQKESLEMFFEKWKGKNEQLDDVLVIGLRL